MNTLTFKNHTIVPFDNGDGKIWFTGKQMTKLLEYEDDKSVNKLYKRNKDEFSEDMTTTVNLPIDAEEANLTPTGKSKGYSNLRKKVRIFSVRGAHLLGMLADTEVAKQLRRWLLDLADKENQTDLSLMDMESLKSLTLGEMQNRLVAADKWSYSNFGRPGSEMMNLRKRHLKKLRKAKQVILELSQLTLPGFDDFPDGEPQT
ncbi:BRO family protein [Photorhabdus sp. RM323S]|uniref:BRO family protein n=1 Tax=Photorhabdus sp. RM323S TaxID=3342828 RepID=UPI0036D91964